MPGFSCRISRIGPAGCIGPASFGRIGPAGRQTSDRLDPASFGPQGAAVRDFRRGQGRPPAFGCKRRGRDL